MAWALGSMCHTARCGVGVGWRKRHGPGEYKNVETGAHGLAQPTPVELAVKDADLDQIEII